MLDEAPSFMITNLSTHLTNAQGPFLIPCRFSFFPLQRKQFIDIRRRNRLFFKWTILSGCIFALGRLSDIAVSTSDLAGITPIQ